jgi:hypothetical protein
MIRRAAILAATLLAASPTLAQQPSRIQIELAGVELALAHAQAEAARLAVERDRIDAALTKERAIGEALQAWWADYLKGLAQAQPPELK